MNKQRDGLALVTASSEHNVAYVDLLALLNKHAAKMTSAEILAIAANLLGRLVALQDANELTRDQVMKIIFENIAEGNHQMCDELGSAARTRH